jgi:phospholipid transport system transporter-binding protein
VTDARLQWSGDRLTLSGTASIGNLSNLLWQLDGLFRGNSRQGDTIAVDCSQLSVSDSAAIALLLEMDRRAGQHGRSLRVSGLGEQLDSLVRLYGVEWLLPEESRGRTGPFAPK